MVRLLITQHCLRVNICVVIRVNQSLHNSEQHVPVSFDHLNTTIAQNFTSLSLNNRNSWSLSSIENSA